MGKLIIVPTPIGNLEDITLRAIRHLKECNLIYAEDTRVTRRLLTHLKIDNRIVAFHAHNEHRILDKCIETIEQNETTVLVSDAGTPGISDPGYLLIRECIKHNIALECLPGPTAIIPALVGSGFPSERFHFEGFLPHKKGRETRILSISDLTCTIIYYESPHRITKTLNQLLKLLGEDRKACVVREISKIYEETFRGSISEAIKYFSNKKIKGEFVICIDKA